LLNGKFNFINLVLTQVSRKLIVSESNSNADVLEKYVADVLEKK